MEDDELNTVIVMLLSPIYKTEYSRPTYQLLGQSYNNRVKVGNMVLCCCCWVLRQFLTSKVISVASDIEHEKSDKFCSEALILV